MLQFEPCQRPTLNEVIGHAWVQAAVPNANEIFTEFQRREMLIRDNSMKSVISMKQAQLSRMETTVDSGPSLQGYRNGKELQ